ncbi:MAG: hypothetical protein R3C11_13435 [Planctomycetaceae bacterium]
MQDKLMTAQDLSGKVAVVTGGANGIGRATRQIARRRGAKVYIGDIKLLPENKTDFAELGIVEVECNVQRGGGCGTAHRACC